MNPEILNYFRTNEYTIHLLVQELVRAEHAEIERACEAALQTGNSGVVLVRDRLSNLKKCFVSDRVPFGEIYEFIGSEEDGEEWVSNYTPTNKTP